MGVEVRVIKRNYKSVITMYIILNILSAFAYAFLFSSCTLLPKEEEVLAPPVNVPKEITFDTVEAKKGTIEDKITCTGYFKPALRKDIFFRNRGGRVKDIYVKLGDKVKKGDLIAGLDTGTIENDIEMQQLQLKKLQISYDMLKTKSELEGGGGKYDLELIAVDIDIQKLRLEALNKELNESKIYSSINGEIVYVKDIKQGENIYAYDAIASVADLKSLQLEYSDDKVSEFKLGVKLDVEIDDEHYSGEVVATPAEAPVNSDELAKRSIRIKVDGIPKDIDTGSRARFSLLLDKREDVIVVSRDLVRNFSGRKFVNILKNGIREERTVETGLQTDTEVEIVKGLEPGELIIVR